MNWDNIFYLRFLLMSSFPSNGMGDTTVVEDTLWRYNGEEWDRVKIGLANRTKYRGNT